jgi:uncharacterized protein
MANFSPMAGLIGGLLIGLGSALYLLANGRLAGISGMLESLLRPTRSGFGLAATFLFGLMAGAMLAVIIAPQVLLPTRLPSVNLPLIIGAGVLVGFGTRMANGCTSGHGVCGLPRLSVRSIAATGIFMATAMVTVFFARHVA